MTAPASPRRRSWPLVVGIASWSMIALVVNTLVFVNIDPGRAQWVADQYTVLTEPSPPEIIAIADATGMSAEGRLIFLASRPTLKDSDTFHEHCSAEGAIVLGCYYARNIYLVDVTDARLEGTTEVTAAHEMLHAAYDRLRPADRARVDELVTEAIALIPPDHPVFDTIAGYDPRQHADEWHSRLGTEFAELPAALEAHYAVYFDDRSLVVALHERSTALLRELEDRIEALVSEVEALDTEITARSAAYEAALARLNSDIAAFNAKNDAFGFTSEAEFNRERDALIARSAALNSEANALNELIDRYNDLVGQLTALDADYADLYRSLDSANAPAAP